MYDRSDEEVYERHSRYVRSETDARPSRQSYTHEGGTNEGEEGEGTRVIQKHTAHSDTMLLRKRKRGRAGGSAGQYRGPPRRGGGPTDRNPHPPLHKENTLV